MLIHLVLVAKNCRATNISSTVSLTSKTSNYFMLKRRFNVSHWQNKQYKYVYVYETVQHIRQNTYICFDIYNKRRKFFKVYFLHPKPYTLYIFWNHNKSTSQRCMKRNLSKKNMHECTACWANCFCTLYVSVILCKVAVY